MTTIDSDALASFLARLLASEIGDIEPVGRGAWSQAFFFSAGGQKKVIRFSAYDEDFRKDRFASRLAAPGMPIPPIEAIGEGLGRFYAISPRVEGTMFEALGAGEARAALGALVDLLVALRAADGAGTTGYGGFNADGNGGAASWREFLTSVHDDAPGSRLGGWKAKLAAQPEANDLHQRGQRILLDLVSACPEERHLVHNDLLHDNLIMRDGRVAAVIDWGCALWGDFLYDLAMFTTWQFYYPALAGIDFAGTARQGFAARGIALPYFDERLRCYQLHLLLDSLRYNAWKGDVENLSLTASRLIKIL